MDDTKGELICRFCERVYKPAKDYTTPEVCKRCFLNLIKELPNETDRTRH